MLRVSRRGVQAMKGREPLVWTGFVLVPKLRVNKYIPTFYYNLVSS